MDRRVFLRRSALSTAAVLGAGQASAGTGFAAAADVATPGEGPYGPLRGPDDNGLMLPEGFSSRVVARSLAGVGASGYLWHRFPDGGACFATPGGGWVYASNSEVSNGSGGCGAVRFSASGEIEAAYPILTGTSLNCAGGPTPWGTWLSCEEHPSGLVWECDPLGRREAIARPAMGTFTHEAVAVDPAGGQLYLTEDVRDGRFYRYTPSNYPDLSRGGLEVLIAAGDSGRVRWTEVPDPSGVRAPTRHQVPESKAFNGGEGIWYDAGFVYFTTKGDDRVWLYDTTREVLDILYDGRALEDPPLTGVDNVVVAQSGDVIVAEDGGDMDLVLITPDRVVARLVKVIGQEESELCGPAFDPSGKRLYFSSQRGPAPRGPGVTYEVRGPFRTARPPAAPTPPQTGTTDPTTGSDPDDGLRLTATGLAAAAGLTGLGLVASALALRKIRERRATEPPDAEE